MLSGLLFLLVPVSILIAIRHYRLWEIDLLVQRTLLYSLLTLTLGLMYYGLVRLLQTLFRLVWREAQNALVTVLSTLAIAALFGPLRTYLQTAIDRHFYRAKYDAGQVLAVFGTGLWYEVHLDRLTARLLMVVDETMQPAETTLRLKNTRR